MPENIVSIPIDKITIPEERWDRDLGDLSGLMLSIETQGVIEPIVVNRAWELIAGRRRFECVKKLRENYLSIVEKWSARYPGFDFPSETFGFSSERVYVKIYEELPFEEQKAIELEENLHRKNLEWHEEDAYIAELHAIRTEGQRKRNEKGILVTTSPKKGGGKGIQWTTGDTAKTINVDRSKVSRAIIMNDEIKKNPSLRLELSQAAALAKVKRQKMLEIRQELSKRLSFELSDCFLLGDNRELIKTIEDESINLVVTDIGYGIDVKEIWKGKNVCLDEGTQFDDTSPLKAMENILALRDDLFRVLAPGSHLYLFCAFSQTHEIMDFFSSSFYVRSVPLIWDKMIPGYNPTPRTGIPLNYEVVLFMTKGSRQFNLEGTGVWSSSKGDVLRCPKITRDKKHINEKPAELIKSFILISSDKGEVVLDPYCGSGVVVTEAVKLGRKGIGFDLNPECIMIAKSELLEATALKATDLETLNEEEEDDISNGDEEFDDPDGREDNGEDPY